MPCWLAWHHDVDHAAMENRGASFDDVFIGREALWPSWHGSIRRCHMRMRRVMSRPARNNVSAGTTLIVCSVPLPTAVPFGHKYACVTCNIQHSSFKVGVRKARTWDAMADMPRGWHAQIFPCACFRNSRCRALPLLVVMRGFLDFVPYCARPPHSVSAAVVEFCCLRPLVPASSGDFGCAPVRSESKRACNTACAERRPGLTGNMRHGDACM